MTTQPEQVLENNLIKQLIGLGYEQVKVTDDADLVANFKTVLERLNDTYLTDHEFKQILNNINLGNIFNRAKILRDRVTYMDGKGDTKTVQLLNGLHLNRNIFQVTQIDKKGRVKDAKAVDSDDDAFEDMATERFSQTRFKKMRNTWQMSTVIELDPRTQ